MGHSVTIESVPNPLEDITTDFILSQNRETAELDFKLTLDIRKGSDFVEIAKDIFAMSNYGGGYLAFGFKETKTGAFHPVGLPTDFHVDQATLQEKFNSHSNEPLALGYKELEKVIKGEKRKFAVIYVPPSTAILKPIRLGTYTKRGKVRIAFRRDEILFRRGTQSVRASQHEIKFIDKRAKDTEYKISLLSGKPDRIKENLYGNFFRVLKSPSQIFVAEIPRKIRFGFFETEDTPYVRQVERIYSFCNLEVEPFKKYIKSKSLSRRDVSEFLETQDGRILLTWLLNSEIKNAALRRGLRYDGHNKNAYFYPTNEPSRHETWKGRFRTTQKQVAKRIYIKQLRRSLVAHDAALLAFMTIGTDFYLKALPRIVLTHDGYETIQGFREGTVKTRLSYNKFNDAYLNLVLFWVSRFKSETRNAIDLGGRILVSTEPVTLSLDWGIMKDRPSREFRDRKEELYSLEAMM